MFEQNYVLISCMWMGHDLTCSALGVCPLTGSCEWGMISDVPLTGSVYNYVSGAWSQMFRTRCLPTQRSLAVYKFSEKSDWIVSTTWSWVTLKATQDQARGRLNLTAWPTQGRLYRNAENWISHCALAIGLSTMYTIFTICVLKYVLLYVNTVFQQAFLWNTTTGDM